VVEVVAGGFHTCVRRKNGMVACWGDGTYGQLGDGTTVERGTPGDVSGVADAVQLAAGGHHTCAVRATGEVTCWGRNGHGQTGDPRADVSNVPYTLPKINDAVEVTAGERFSCARRRSGAVTCWGDRPGAMGGDQGPCDLLTRDLPPDVSKGITSLSAGGGHACASREKAAAVCWGDNRSGELGGKTDAPTCQLVEVSLGDVVELAAGRAHTCARTATGQVACWGDNERGQLGGGTKHKGTPLPTPVPGLTDAEKIVAAHDHTCALRRGGVVVCWGSNQRGELGGDGTVVTVSVP
jgi:alpha-tubulin suppressor-like RCC1 family protein